MSNFLITFFPLILLLALILVLAKAAGYLSTVLHQPAVLGELVVGVLLGPSLLNITHQPFFDLYDIHLVVHDLAEIGVLLLMFIAGLEFHVRDLAQSSKVSVFAGTLGVVFPVVLCGLCTWMFDQNLKEAAFVGLTLGATSVSISAQTLIELRALRSRVGFGLLGSAVFDDVLVILFFSIALAVFNGGTGSWQVLWVLARMVLFLTGAFALGWWLLPKLIHLVSRLPITQSLLTLSLVVMFVFSATAELLGGVAAITGAFLAGLVFGHSVDREQLERGIHALAYSIFVPIFFVSIGLSVNVRLLKVEDLWFTLIILVVAVLGKVFGSGLGAFWGGFSRREALLLGAGMVSRGEVGLIIVTVSVLEGLISERYYSIIVAAVIFTTLITPPLLRFLYRYQSPAVKTAPDELLQIEQAEAESENALDKEAV